MELLNFEDVTFSVDELNRTIHGLVVPWNGTSTVKDGKRFRFAPGSIKAVATKFVKFFEDHTPLKNLGRAIQMEETDRGLEMVFRVRPGAEGDRAIQLAQNGLKNGLSVGVEFDSADMEPTDQPDTFLVKLANLMEVSLVKDPSFDDSRIIQVYASATPLGELMETDEKVVDTTNSAGNEAPANDKNDQVKPVAFSIPEGYELVKVQADDRPEVVKPRNTNVSVVTEPKNYVFDNSGTLQNAKYDFGIDVIQGLNPQFNNVAARQRVEEFINAQFDVVTSNVNELAPNRNVPRYVDLRDYSSPVFDAVRKGTVTQMNGGGTTPFQWPVYSSSSGLVAAGTEGTEPSSGTYVTTLATVTPTTLRGKAKISREAWDSGTTPNLGDTIFRQMVRDYREALEAKIVATLDAATPTSFGTLTAGGGTDHQTLVTEMRHGLALLQFARGGKTMDVMFAQADLYLALIDAVDDAGRPIFPAVGPQNADGSVANQYGAINVNGTTVLPAWALAAVGQTAAASSYLIDTNAVDAWADAPRRLFFDIEVSNVYLGIWGYAATVINDIAGVREVSYDPVA